ncbi:MAG: HDOD domain-containing protein [Deltaproteobacteria bacterium]|nr:HDOD domain-containing protein [Deltaproteobacteria bacterium]
MTEENTTSGAPTVFFTKQPILDAHRSIWGYELLGGEEKGGLYEIFPQKESTVGLSSSTYLGLQEPMERGKKIMVGFDETGILTGVPYALPPANSVVRVLAGGEVQAPGLEAALQTLRQEGYQINWEVHCDRPLPDALYAPGDIFSFDLTQGKPDLTLLARGGHPSSRLLARDIKTHEQYSAAKDLGFALFQGPFFKKPEYVPDRQLGSNQVARFNLFQLLEVEDPDVKVLAEAILSDVSISFRLLSYLNSAWFGFRHNIQSIDQAIMILGWIKLKSWLQAVLFVDLVGKEEVPREVAALSLQRGKFFELLAKEYDYWGYNPNTLFLLGLFSLLDTILGLPMDQIVELLPLEVKLKAALRQDLNNEYRPLFELLDSLEIGDWATLDSLTQNLLLDLNRVKAFFAQARDWAGGFFTQIGAAS